jgi:AAA family ATP:ADP antiporter
MMAHVERIFSMRRGEFGPSSLLFFYMFLVVGAFYVGQSVGDALFLKEYPRHLPYVMIGTALMIGAFAAIYIRLAHWLGLEPLVIGTLLFFACSFVLFWWLSLSQLRWVYFLVYIWVQTLGVMGPMMGWTLANFLLTTREARRAFAFIAAGGTIGVVFLGFVTSDLLRHGRCRPQMLFLAIAALAGICALMVRLLYLQGRQRLSAMSLAPWAGQRAPRNFRQSFRTIRDSRYLRLLTLLVAVGCMATTILTYQFKLIAKISYGADAAGLGSFYSRFYAYMGLATFVFQLAVTGPLLRAVGIRWTLFVLPFTLMGSSLGLFLAPMLLTASILRGSHYLLRYSLDQSSRELLYLPIASGVKSQVKSFIDTFIWRSADGVAGLVLLFFVNLLKFSPSRVSLINMVTLAVWVGIASGVRREYLTALRQAIDRRTLDPDRTAAGVLDATTTQVLAQALQRPEEQQVLYGLNLFDMGREASWHPALRGLLEHPSPVVRQRALRLLGDAGDRKILPQVERMLGDESVEVRTEALNYLVTHTGCDPLSLIPAGAKFKDYSVPGLVVAYLARPGEAENLPAAQLLLENMLSQTGPDAPRARCEAARALGAIPTPCELHSKLFALLDDESLEVQEQGLLSAGKILDRDFLPPVISKLEYPRLRWAARAALIQYGDRAVDRLQASLNDPAVPLPVRKSIPDIVARIATPAAAAVLANSLIQSDPGLRYDVLKALNKLRRSNPALLPVSAQFTNLLDAEIVGFQRSFQILAALDPEAGTAGGSPGREALLTRALRERMDHELERIFRLLALLYPPRDVYNAYVGLNSRRPQLQANSLEMLEHLLEPDLYKRLSRALDPEVPLQEKLDFARRLCRASVNSKVEALRILLHSEDRWMRACALYTVGQCRVLELLGEVRELPHDADSLITQTRAWTEARLGATIVD